MTKTSCKTIFPCLISLLAFTSASPLVADPGDWELGFQGNAMFGSGEPANDILGYGIFVKKQINQRAKVAGGIDIISGADFEDPALYLRIPTPAGTKPNDSKYDSTGLSVWYEQAFGSTINKGFFWKAGAGVSNASASTVTGATASGGTYSITTDPGTEFLVLGGLGYTTPIGKSDFLFTGSLDAQYNIADWEVTDTISGTSKSLGSYFVYGVKLGISYRF